MTLFLLILLISFVIIGLCALGLSTGLLFDGKSRLTCRRCGFDPTEQKTKEECKLCGSNGSDNR